MLINAAYAYERDSIQSASREEVLLKLFEGGIRFLKMARKCWHEGDKRSARDFRSKAMAIITELHATLDREKGDKEIVKQLESLYAFMISEMIKIGMNDDFDKLKDIEEIMEKLYTGFREAAKELKKTKIKSRERPYEPRVHL